MTYNALTSACEKGKHLERALEFCEAMKQQGLVPNTSTDNTLMGACDKCKGRQREQVR